MKIEYKGLTIECFKDICDELRSRIPYIEKNISLIGRRVGYDEVNLEIAIDKTYLNCYGKDVIEIVGEIVIKHI